jgi:hypothetical protein
MNVFKLKIGTWDGDQCVIYTNLKEEQIRKVLEPMVKEQDEMNYFIEDYVVALEDAYPSKIVLSNFSYQTPIQL